MVSERSDFAKTRAIALTCRRLGIPTIAGLREIGIDYAQGFGIRKPGPIGNSD